MTRIFFATDIHGSEVCWRKFLNAGKFYNADVLILGGDMTGKALVPIVCQPDGTYRAALQDEEFTLKTEDEVQEMERRMSNRGYYPFRATPEQLAELEANPAKLDALFHAEIIKVVERWMALADERLNGSGRRCFVCPGNDDAFEIDEVIRRSRHVVLAEGQVVTLPDGFEMISTGWSNRTPWKTCREEDEADLRHRIERMAAQVRDARRAVFNLHCPPYGSYLDQVPELDETLRPRNAGQTLVPVGSTAVRDLILDSQPLLSLHGHIHESKGAVHLGRTLSINPGSTYGQGTLLCAVVDLDSRKGVRHYVLTAG